MRTQISEIRDLWTWTRGHGLGKLVTYNFDFLRFADCGNRKQEIVNRRTPSRLVRVRVFDLDTYYLCAPYTGPDLDLEL